MSRLPAFISPAVAASLPQAALAEGGMPQLRFETFPSQIFWLVVTFTALYFVISRLVLPQVRTTLRARETRIGADREQADELRKEAEAAHQRASEALAAARADSDRILREAHDQAAEALRSHSQRLQAELDKERSEAEARIEASRGAALQDAERAASDLVRSVTRSLAGLDVNDGALAHAVSQAAKDQAA